LRGKSEIERIKEAAWELVRVTKNDAVKVEALKIVAGCKGVLLPDLNEKFLTVKQIVQVRQAKQSLVERVLRTKARRKKENRRAYLRRELKRLKAAPQPQETTNA
jgi:hypothetical protein